MNTWRKIVSSPLGKGLSLFLVLNLTLDTLMPTAVMALSGGPSQPEFQGFTEIGVSNMVDPFTGDFSYEIPLMTVPGPNGGYPINLNYMAGPGMEDEASWVGLGWTLNPGAINRNMRGVPDDFSGPQENENNEQIVSNTNSDHITKSFFTKNNVTVGIGVGLNLTMPEIGGADLSFIGVSPNVNLYYNTYKGVGIRSGVGIKLSTQNQESGSGNLSAGLNLNFDSNDGASAQPSLSMSAKGESTTVGASIGFGYSSRQGITNTFLNTSLSSEAPLKNAKKYTKGAKAGEDRTDGQSIGNGISFATTSGVPSTSMAMAGFNTGFNLDFEAGAMQTEFDIPVSFNGMLSVQKVKEWMIDGYAYPAYGTLYSGYRENGSIENGRALMDYNREKDFSINLKTPMLPMPVMTHDVYTVQGAGIGGSFRAFRNDAGLFYEPSVTSDFLGVTIGVEVAASTGFKIGVDPSVNFSHSYSGKWKVEEDIAQVASTNFFRKPHHYNNGGIAIVQPFDFRFTNEMTAQTEGDNRFATLGGQGAKNFTLFPANAEFPNLSEQEYEDPDAMEQMSSFFPFDNLGKFKPKASNKLGGVPVMATQTLRTQKERKIQLVEYRTKKEIQLSGVTTHVPQVFVSNPAEILPSKTDFDLSQSAIKNHHISEFSILQPGGMRYVYGLPLYNRAHEEYYFAVDNMFPNTTPPSKVPIPGLLSILAQRKGEHGDKFFSTTKISPYVHSHLITHIVSPDYIDVDNNGPSEDDYGYWTKFNYQAIQNYKWRAPVKSNEANYIQGLISNPNDDKATFTYGERDMTYLHSIETKTHVAVFFVSDRDDAQEVTGITGGVTSTNKMKKLDRIELYSKNDLDKPIKSVHFNYGYELCNDSDNHPTSSSDGNRGKLTLKSLYFQYGDSPKGQLTPYIFEYGEIYQDEIGADAIGLVEDNSGLDGNPKYQSMNNDRWGSYKVPAAGTLNQDNPYVNQKEGTAEADERQVSATVWSLTSITLPTGAKIKVAYEMDDYAFVQDKPATQMYQIAGIGNGSGSPQMLANPSSLAEITNNFKRVYFYLDEQTDTEADVKRMLDETPDAKVYFKTWQRLQIPKGPNSTWAFDYVTGYAPILKDNGTYGIQNINSVNYGFFTIADDPTGPPGAQNFFRKAGLQYLRYQRADLDMPQNQADAALQAASMILTGIPIIMQALELIKGYYRFAISRDYCKYIGNGKPSFIKLGSADGVKYGGGHRVRKITISDAWSDMSSSPSATYGMEYFYHTKHTDGRKISSGVASYEPLIGGDENPLRKAHYYGADNKFSHNDPAFFMEEPFGESYFPSPSVGYSKVTIVNLANKIVTKTGDGIQEKEFYTAKDFPIKATFTPQPQRIEDKQTVFIPLIASITLKGYGYSQGYYVELNDMHGKPKGESLYDADYWNSSTKDWVEQDVPFVSKKIYKYKSSGNSLDNTVDVLDGDQQVRTAIMGESSEMFSEMKEDFGYSIGAGAQINGGIDPVPVGIFVTVFPNFEYSENSARTLVTTKVVYKMGILEEVVEMAEGATKTTKNLLYDPENGSPLLTVVTSDYDDVQSNENNQYIYNYTYPAYWHYSGMQPAYKNYRNYYEMASTTFPGANQYFEKGDELLSSTGDRVWVQTVSQSGIYLVKKDGTEATLSGPTKFVTIKSGKRNLQNVPSGNLTSLKTPIGNYYNPLLDFYNNNVFNNPAYNSNLSELAIPFPSEGIKDCATDFVYEGGLSINQPTTDIIYPHIKFNYLLPGGLETCDMVIRIPDAVITLGLNPSKIYLSHYSNTQIKLTYYNTSSDIKKYVTPLSGKCPNLNFCMDGVLNASADEFSDKWQYNAEFDAGGSTFADLNEYLKGNRGIWRKLRTNSFFVERKQRSTVNTDNNYATPNTHNTYIGRDGTYQSFSVFNWLLDSNSDGIIDGNANNAQANKGWRWQAEVTPYGYSPYGYEIENRDALNIYSSQLYGYKNSMVTAASQNAAYHEIGFDGFEESPAGTYIQHGHIKLATQRGASIEITDADSHTGDQCLKINAAEDGNVGVFIPVIGPPDVVTSSLANQIQFIKGRNYVLSFWYKFAEPNPSQLLGLGYKEENHNDSPWPGTYSFNSSNSPIESWRRAEVILKTQVIWDLYFSDGVTPVPTSVNSNFNIFPGGVDLYIDDLRIHPADAPFKSYVFSPFSYQLRAILDDNNYATFYNYDAENTLVQVKKETVEGIKTIQTTRKNVRIQPGN